jgi:hypothetical protein
VASKAVEIELGGKIRKLKATAWAVAEFADKSGIEIRFNHLNEDVGALMEKPLPPRVAIIALWAALIHEDESLTVKQVGEMLDLGDMGHLSKVWSAFFSLFGARLSETERQTVVSNLLNDQTPAMSQT